MAGEITPSDLYNLLCSDQEHALIDVRDVGPFSQNHLLFAAPLPISRLELLVTDLLPRKSLPVVVCDDGEKLAETAAARLGELGYSNVRVLSGGVSGWRDAGYQTFSGVNVPSKAFGEFVEHEEQTPSIDAIDLQRMVEAGDELVILDSRPFDEFNWASIPGGICCSGAELVYRAATTAPGENTTIIVNCAGRTRSIIGAQSLVNAGLPNRVVALRNGIMGWRLAGYQPASGETAWARPPSAAGLQKAKASARRVQERFDVQTIDPAGLEAWRAERDEKTLYVLDVRTMQEFEAGRLEDAVHAPGGQLVQATDQYVGARNARIVLVDDDGVRAIMTASWLIQMGQHHVRVLNAELAAMPLVKGPRPLRVAGEWHVETIGTDELFERKAESRLILDFSLSTEYKRGHLPGAWFVQRSRLAECVEALPAAEQIVLTCADGALARVAAGEVQSLVDVPVRVLGGGNAAWVKAGNSLINDEHHFAVEPNDVWKIPFIADAEKGQAVEDAMRAYLDWEVDLARDVEKDGTARFRRFRSVG